jgi:hypothetical protein
MSTVSVRKRTPPWLGLREAVQAVAADPILVVPLIIVLVLCVTLGVIAWFRFG